MTKYYKPLLAKGCGFLYYYTIENKQEAIMLVKMTVKQIREIKPYMYFVVPPEDMLREEEYDFVFSGDNAYKIHRMSGYTHVLQGYCTALGFDKEIKQAEGLHEAEEVFVELYLLQAWLGKSEQ